MINNMLLKKGCVSANCIYVSQFCKQVTMRIDENIFQPLSCRDNGTPNAPVRVLVAMIVLKEAEGLSDQKIFENCRFNLLVRCVIGLYNADDPLPTESTIKQLGERTLFFAKYAVKSILADLYFATKSFLTAILPINLSRSENNQFSAT